MNKLRGPEDAGILHHRETLAGDTFHQRYKVGILHLGGNGLIIQKAAKHRQRRVQGVQTGADLHFLRLLHGGPIGEVDTCLFQRRPTVGEMILQHQILRHLGIDEGGGDGAGGAFGDGHARHAQSRQLVGHLLGGVGVILSIMDQGS